jgi:DNA-binding response OmpR family regulator
VSVPQRILVVEDEPAIADAIEYNLASTGYDVDVVTDGARAAERDLNAYDLAILDLMLPGLAGDEVCRRWRAQSIRPVLMLTARTSVAERVLGLEVGADDYLGKPFSMPELLARVRAILRRRDLDRAAHKTPSRLSVDGLHLDLLERTLTVNGRPVSLTPLEFRLLALLASRPGHTFTRDDITQHLWQRSHDNDDRACDTHVKNVRQKIEDDPSRPQLLVTVRGIGYLLREPH